MSPPRSSPPRAGEGLGWACVGGAPAGVADAASQARAATVLRALAAEPAAAFYDVRVLVGDAPPFHAHRAVLAVQSSVFRAMFASGMREACTNEVTLGDVTPAAFAAVLRHVYGGSMAGVSREVLVDVFRFAHRMDMPELDTATTHILLRGVLAPLPDLRAAWHKTAACPPASDPPPPPPAVHQPALGARRGQPAAAPAGAPAPAASAPSSAAAAAAPPSLNAFAGSSVVAAADPFSTAPLGARPLDQAALRASPLTFLAAEVAAVLDSPEFCSFSFALLERLLSSDNVVAPEVLLFTRAMGACAALPSSTRSCVSAWRCTDLLCFPSRGSPIPPPPAAAQRGLRRTLRASRCWTTSWT
jgi:hypothetical protein